MEFITHLWNMSSHITEENLRELFTKTRTVNSVALISIRITR
jgi:hypothetical protein